MPDLPILRNYGKNRQFALADPRRLAKGQVVQYFFIFMQFWEKLAKIVGLRPNCGMAKLVWEVLDPPLVYTYFGFEKDLSFTEGSNHLHGVLWMNVICNVKHSG